ncbi:kinase-like protein [Viridothelium virens]|uniref:Kinase-like protein n=1 Tax=Viridothelium virens TaxID=1048519 RepID=A0A6A6H6I0_VIRVR|nr:kinase-like protein [Viridothelium virens]
MQQPGVCGMLHPFMERGSLDSEIKRANATGSRLTLTDKARWCYEMSSAVFHTHFVARTYHMDIKPANFLLNAENDVILIDWEQSGAPHYTLAPEADGTWDVRFLEVDPSHENAHNAPPARLIYKRYNGPPRENSVWSWPQWNVFPEWRERFPRALEAAETFSLGRTLWLLLEQVSQSEIENNRSVVVAWSKGEEDIPDDWKAIVYRCLEPDPNDRIGLAEVLNFWKDANKNYPTNSPQTSS